MLQELEDKGRRYLVRRVCYTYIEEGHWGLDGVTLYHLEFVRVPLALDTLRDFSNHAWIDFHCNDLLAAFEQLHGQVTGTGPDLEHDICRLYGCLVHNLLDNLWILQDMLPETLIESKVIATVSSVFVNLTRLHVSC